MQFRTLPVFLAFMAMGFADAVGPFVSLAKDEFQLSNAVASMIPFAGLCMFGLLSIPVFTVMNLLSGAATPLESMPEWLLRDGVRPASRALLYGRLQQHITDVMGRYRNDVYCWDVVNEALNEDGTMRKSIFLDKLGPDFVTEAFRLAQQAAPTTELYYNDYNNEQPAKREGCIRLMQKIKDAGVRIDGVGIQGHWHLGKVPFKEIEASILAYSAMGLKVMFTELDIEVLPRNFSGADVGQRMASDPSLNPYVNGLPDSVQQQLAKDYEELFRLFLKHQDKISRVTFWGVNDGQSWLNGWPVRGRTNYPLLFDRNNQPKPAYYKVMQLKSRAANESKGF